MSRLFAISEDRLEELKENVGLSIYEFDEAVSVVTVKEIVEAVEKAYPDISYEDLTNLVLDLEKAFYEHKIKVLKIVELGMYKIKEENNERYNKVKG